MVVFPFDFHVYVCVYSQWKASYAGALLTTLVLSLYGEMKGEANAFHQGHSMLATAWAHASMNKKVVRLNKWMSKWLGADSSMRWSATRLRPFPTTHVTLVVARARRWWYLECSHTVRDDVTDGHCMRRCARNCKKSINGEYIFPQVHHLYTHQMICKFKLKSFAARQSERMRHPHIFHNLCMGYMHETS